MLALSNANYDSFVEGDLSAFSKKYVVLPFDPPIKNPTNGASENPYDSDYKYDDNLMKYYLEYVRNGGNLIVLIQSIISILIIMLLPLIQTAYLLTC